MRLKIYSDKAFISPVKTMHCAMLSPFWGKGESTFWSNNRRTFDDYITNGQAYFEMVDTMDAADLAILPSTWFRYLEDGTHQVAYDFAQKAKDAGKPIVVFHERDHDVKFPFDNVLYFSPAIDDARGKREFGLPGWAPDRIGAAAPAGDKEAKPKIGFCGWIPKLSAKEQIKQQLRMRLPAFFQQSLGAGKCTRVNAGRNQNIRYDAVTFLAESKLVETDFILNGSFFAGANEKKKELSREEAEKRFMDNLTRNDYSLCARGVGNYSLRFSETLAAGRVPLFYDTQCVLPYDFAVDWQKEFPWITEAGRGQADKAVAAFHDAHTVESFKERQTRMRFLFDEWVSADGFFRNFHLHMDQI